MDINMRILLVEDNDSIVMGLQYLLEQEGYQIQIAGNITDARFMLDRDVPDIILLDVVLPDGDGFAFCSNIRKHYDIPVIFLTSKEEEADVVKGFELGAEDYIIKPFRNRELISRIKNVLRRNGKGSKFLQCGDISLNLESGKVFRDGEEIVLTRLEYRILSVMLSRPGKLFTREEILAEVWDMSGNFVNDNTLSVTMKRIREKIGDKDGRLIKTVRGMGYRVDKE